VVICARHPAALDADHRGRGYAAYLAEPFEVQTLIDLVAALCLSPMTGVRAVALNRAVDRRGGGTCV